MSDFDEWSFSLARHLLEKIHLRCGRSFVQGGKTRMEIAAVARPQDVINFERKNSMLLDNIRLIGEIFYRIWHKGSSDEKWQFLGNGDIPFERSIFSAWITLNFTNKAWGLRRKAPYWYFQRTASIFSSLFSLLMLFFNDDAASFFSTTELITNCFVIAKMTLVIRNAKYFLSNRPDYGERKLFFQ